ncbi:MAG: hypothetical protein FJ387_17990 [Verrucomicrobia bacterium]|nr:hypothetical protein [Verrucomicrobiota bacterium]
MKPSSAGQPRPKQNQAASPPPVADTPGTPRPANARGGPGPAGKPAPTPAQRGFAVALALLLVVLGGLFSRSFQPGQILFSSDGPIGANAAQAAALPAAFTGYWQDLNWLGAYTGNASPTVTYLLLWVLGPLAFAKFYAPISLLLLGLSAWVLLRQLGFRPSVCALGALAAALNTDFFSYACWGLGTLALAVAWLFLALAALVTPVPKRWWLKPILAGAAVGMSIMEGFDNGAIFSLYVAAFVIFQALQNGGATKLRGWLLGLGRVGLVAICAAAIAAQALSMLIATQVKGVVGMQQDARTKTQRWEDATQWSLPKLETLRVVIPGLFGYRMDTPEGGNYWGRVGERPGFMTRHSGAGVYGGLFVVAVALWGLLAAGRGAGSPFTPSERRWVWFWGGALVVSLLLAWGKYAPFYRVVYALPYFSTVRNPIKFLHPFSVSLVILFGFGLEALARAYFDKSVQRVAALKAQLALWWAGATTGERRWTIGGGAALGTSLLAWLMYGASRTELVAHLKQVGFPDPPDLPPGETGLADAIAQFSSGELGWFILFLALTLGVLVLVQSAVLGGRRAPWATLCFGLLIAADFARANTPWIYYWNFTEKYASNPLLDFLRVRPYEQRVAVLPFNLGPEFGSFQQYYHSEWMQHHFQYYNVQSVDIIQEPRTAADNKAYREALIPNTAPDYVRLWQLTNTRYVLGLAGSLADTLNNQLDPQQKRFRVRLPFTLAQARPGGPISTLTNAAGPLALLEFTGALPRAQLYAQWLAQTNTDQTLKTLADPAFDPNQIVLVNEPAPELPAPATNAATHPRAGTVEFVHYAPKQLTLQAQADRPAVLLLNDKFDPRWRVTVNGQPAPLLRCNFLMRGVYLPPGDHRLEFRFGTSWVPLGVSLLGLAAAVGALGLLWLSRAPHPKATDPR